MRKPPLTLILAALVVVSAALILPSNADQVSSLSAVVISVRGLRALSFQRRLC